MKKFAFHFVFMALLVCGFSVSQAWAQKPLKGGWTFTFNTPMGALPLPVTFKSAGKGTVSAPAGNLPLSYRESGANFSIALEGPGLNPAGGDLTFVIRGTKTDSSVTGTAYAITDTADPSSPIGFTSAPLMVTGKRN